MRNNWGRFFVIIKRSIVAKIWLYLVHPNNKIKGYFLSVYNDLSPLSGVGYMDYIVMFYHKPHYDQTY